jgi:hypothetical protein
VALVIVGFLAISLLGHGDKKANDACETNPTAVRA